MWLRHNKQNLIDRMKLKYLKNSYLPWRSNLIWKSKHLHNTLQFFEKIFIILLIQSLMWKSWNISKLNKNSRKA